MENLSLAKYLSGYDDVWVYLKNDTPDDRGYTFDSEKNTMLLTHGSGYEKMRYDRVLVKSLNAEGVGWEANEIRLIGTQEIQPEVFPSDHFGLVVSLAYKNDGVLECVVPVIRC